MNTSGINRMLFREQEEKRKSFRATIALYAFVAVIVVSALCLVCLLLGHKMGFAEGKKYALALPKPAPVVVQPANLIECNRNGLDEILRICRMQKRMEKVTVK